MHLRFLGHAGLAVEIDGTLLLTDAILRNRVAFLRWFGPTPALRSLRTVTATLISHLHHDHCDPTSLSLLGRDRTLVVPAGGERFFRRRGFTDVRPVAAGETLRVGAVDVTATLAAHHGRREPFGPATAAIGYLLTGLSTRVYFAGDTDLFPQMRDLADGLDVALLPVSGWGRTLGLGHLDPLRAAEAVSRLSPALAVPMHWGGLRPSWHRAQPLDVTTAAPTAFAAEVHRRDLPTAVTIVPPGGSLSWPPADGSGQQSD